MRNIRSILASARPIPARLVCAALLSMLKLQYGVRMAIWFVPGSCELEIVDGAGHDRQM